MSEKSETENEELTESHDDQNLTQSMQKEINLLKCLDLDKDTEMQKSSIQVLNALEFLSNCFQQNELGFDKLEENQQITIVNVLLSFIYMLIELFKDSNEQSIESRERILNDISNTLEILSKNSNVFIIKFHEASNKSIESIFSLLDSITDKLKNDKAKKIKEQIRKLLLSLVYMSEFNSNYHSNWKSIGDILTSLKLRLAICDEITDLNWLTFLIYEHLKQNKISTNYFDCNELLENQNQNYEIKVKLIISFFKFTDMSNFVCKGSPLCFMANFLNIDYQKLDKILSNDDQKFLIDFIIKIFEKLYNDSIILIEKFNTSNNISEENRNELEYIFSSITDFTNLFGNLVDVSLQQSIFVHNNSKGLKILFDFINCQILLEFYLKYPDILKECYSLVLLSLNNLSRLNYKYIKKWNAYDPVDSLLKFLDKTGEDFKLDIYVLIAFIATEKQIELLPEIKTAIQTIVGIIRDCVNTLDPNSNAYRKKIQLNENEESQDILHIEYKDIEWNIIELLESLYHMSVNDTIKKEIYETNKMKDVLKKLILAGNNFEKSYALKLLYQLCFDQAIVNDLSKDVDFMNFLKDLSNDQSNDLMKKSCDGILWKSNSLHQEGSKLRKASFKMKSDEIEKKQIMISYNGESRQTCMSIKAELEKLGYIIWIDVENIAGSSLESMAEAIEKSFCILMGMTEKYKMSPNCRLEAEYAVQLNKPIIPLILQEGYKPNGWLGIILGSKIFVNFKKYSFEECTRRLLHEIKKIDQDFDNKIEKDPNTSPGANKPNKENEKPIKKNEILIWKEDDVEKWIQDKKFCKHIIDNIRPCNGKILYQMFNMLETVPEFFYTSIRADSNNRVTLRDLAEFSFELKQLFN